MVGSAVVVLVALTFYPMVYMFWISLHEWPIVPTLPRSFVGLEQYLSIVADPRFWNSVGVSALYLVVSVTLQVVLGFALALLVADLVRGASVLRVLFMMPIFVSPIVAGLVWRFMFGYDLGIVNYFLSAIDLPRINWLGNAWGALTAVIVVDVWQWTPFSMLILLAGLASVPSSPYEAAAIDGASPRQVFRFITLPMMMPVLAVVVLFRVIDAFKMFDLVFILTRGGPGEATNVVALDIWRKGFYENQLGAAAARSVIMVVGATLLAALLARAIIPAQKTGDA